MYWEISDVFEKNYFEILYKIVYELYNILVYLL